MDSDSNHDELGDKYENQSSSTSMTPVRVVDCAIVPGVIPNFGRGKLISSYMMKFGLNICIVNAVVDVDDDGGKNER